MAIKHIKTSAKADGADNTLVQPSDWNAAHVSQFRVVTAGETLVESDAIVCVLASAQSFALPVSASIGAQFIVRNSTASTASALIDPGAGRSIDYAPGRSLAAAAVLACAPGETLRLVTRTASVFELAARQAVTLTASVTIAPAVNFEASVTVTAASITPTHRVLAWLTPNADWDADDLAGYTVTATPGTGSIDFLIAGPGPIGGTLDITYQWS